LWPKTHCGRRCIRRRGKFSFMADQLQSKILSHVKSDRYQPQKPDTLAKQLSAAEDASYPAFRDALRELMHSGRVALGAGGTVVVELTHYPDGDQKPQGVISEVLGAAGEKDVDLKTVIVAHDLPEEFPEEVRAQARRTIDQFNPDDERGHRVDLRDEVICTIDP